MTFSAEVQPFVDGIRRSRIVLQFCVACRRSQGPGRLVCAWCSGELRWEQAEVAPVAAAMVRIHRSPLDPGLLPLTLCLVRIGEGTSLLARWAGPEHPPDPGDAVALSWVDGDGPGVLLACPVAEP